MTGVLAASDLHLHVTAQQGTLLVGIVVLVVVAKLIRGGSGGGSK